MVETISSLDFSTWLERLRLQDSAKVGLRKYDADIALESTDTERRPLTGFVRIIMNLGVIKNENLVTIRANVPF